MKNVGTFLLSFYVLLVALKCHSNVERSLGKFGGGAEFPEVENQRGVLHRIKSLGRRPSKIFVFYYILSVLKSFLINISNIK